MKYYIIAGEASGDLHASGLMRALKEHDPQADFRFFGGDLMAAEGGVMVRHYRELAYMGFIPVLTHLPTILGNMKACKRDIVEWGPDAVILVDYPGFNLSIAKFVKARTGIPVYYYISPKIWAWKEYRIKSIRRDVDEMFSILPFEVPFYEEKHGYPIHYVGNPTVAEVAAYLAAGVPSDGFSGRSVIALLPGSRRQEIRDNLPAMLAAAEAYAGSYRVVVAGAPGIDRSYYDEVMAGSPAAEIVYGRTYELLAHAVAAVVTSGTATLETALFGVPQVVCYKTPIPCVISFLKRHLLKVEYVSLVNLIAGREVVRELVASSFSVENIRSELSRILPGGDSAGRMADDYAYVRSCLGSGNAPDAAARIMVGLLADGSRACHRAGVTMSSATGDGVTKPR